MRFPLGGFELKRLVPKMVSDLEKAAVLSLRGDPKRYGTHKFKIGSMCTLYFALFTNRFVFYDRSSYEKCLLTPFAGLSAART